VKPLEFSGCVVGSPNPTWEDSQLALLQVVQFFSRPEGATTYQPRATPWDEQSTPIGKALKGRDRTARHSTMTPPMRPFQGLGHLVRRGGPGALPGPVFGYPFGAKSRSRHIKTGAWRRLRVRGSFTNPKRKRGTSTITEAHASKPHQARDTIPVAATLVAPVTSGFQTSTVSQALHLVAAALVAAVSSGRPHQSKFPQPPRTEVHRSW
jgi:hypothetical protein